MNSFILLSGSAVMLVLGFATVRVKEMSSSLVAGGLVLLWVALAVMGYHP